MIDTLQQRRNSRIGRGLLIAIVVILVSTSCRADGPFFVTYTSRMEEPRDLEIDFRGITGNPEGGNRFGAGALEFEYGATAWWTTELYLDGQATANESAFFTGFRWENRLHLLPNHHWINPVLYFEFENLNGADKTLLEVVGRDGIDRLRTPVDVARREHEREMENKLILDSSFKGWTIAENFIASKDFSNRPWEFGYTVGVTHRFPKKISLRNVQAGVEIFGGLGTANDFGLSGTSHYLGPVVTWSSGHGIAVKLSPNFGLTDTSARFLLRAGVSYEIEDFGRAVVRVFHGR